MLRSLLKTILKFLSRFAIRKHKIRVVAVSGWYGTWLAKESIYLTLKDDYKVRRNVSSIDWDFSIPLTILGYEDKRYSPLGWLNVIFSTSWVLLFERSNPHIQVLELDANKREIYEYWLSIMQPEVLVLINSRPGMENVEELLVSSLIKDGLLIYEEDKKDVVMKYLPGTNAITRSRQESVVDDQGQPWDLDTIYPDFIEDMMIVAIPVAEYMRIPVRAAVEKLNHFEIPKSKLKNVKEQLND